MSITTAGNPFVEPGFSELPMPAMGGCWVRQPDDSLDPDPNEPDPPDLREEPAP